MSKKCDVGHLRYYRIGYNTFMRERLGNAFFLNEHGYIKLHTKSTNLYESEMVNKHEI